MLFSFQGFASPTYDEYRYERKYQVGNSFGYVLKTNRKHNGQFAGKDTGTSNQTVILKKGIPFETVKWTSLIKSDAAGNIEDLSRSAQSVKPYQISLHPDGTIEIPPLDEVPDMVGMMTDLNTYYVAISPAIGISNITKSGDVYQNPEQHIGDWSGGMTIVGQDCTLSTLTMVNLDSDNATVRTTFFAPKSECLEMKYEWMNEPVNPEYPNNFQLIKKVAEGSFNVMWGHEQFIIENKIDRATGKILNATMDNTLTLKMKVGCDENLNNCQAEFPFAIQRDEVLTLITQ